MSSLLAFAFAIVAATVAQIFVPGRTLYHAGWFNVALAAAIVLVVRSAGNPFRRSDRRLVRAAIVLLVLGAAIVGFAGVASGLLAPDGRIVSGAPGSRVDLPDFSGALVFPLLSAGASGASIEPFYAYGNRRVRVGQQWRDAGTASLRAVWRTVVSVHADDLRGAALTVTQPTGSAFLSPILLMQHHQTIAGMKLPYDSFAVPAAHRIVKAVLFTAEQVSGLNGAPSGQPAVLFAVDDANDRPLPGGIGLAPEGRRVRLDGLLLRANVLRYPAVEIVAVPSLAAVWAGSLVLLLGLGVLAYARLGERTSVGT